MNTPYDVIDQAIQIGIKKRQTPYYKLFILGLLAGGYIALGGLLAATLSAGTITGIGTSNPIIPRLLGAMVFPIGLIFVVLVGAELFTGNTAMLIPAVVKRKIPIGYLFLNWGFVFVANCVGALLFDYFLAFQTDLLGQDPYTAYIKQVATYKTSMPWFVVFFRGIGANWLVCLAVWLALSSKSMIGKLVGLWWPIMAFVAIGFEHSIANMFFIPTGIMYGADVSWTALLWNNLTPAVLGNILGGAVFVGCTYSYLYTTKKP